MANSQPKNIPAIPESVRLERVRNERGYADSLWRFWKELTAHRPGDLTAKRDAAGNYDLSYEAARNYHFDRHAPGHYYAQVARVFEVRLEWLLSGDGGMTVDEDIALQGAWEVEEDGAIVSSEWTESHKEAVRLHHRLHKAFRVHRWDSLPKEATEMVEMFLKTLVRRKGIAWMNRELTGHEKRKATEEDIVGFIMREFADPLFGFGNAPYGQRLAAFHNRMAMLWLREFAEERWGGPSQQESRRRAHMHEESTDDEA